MSDRKEGDIRAGREQSRAGLPLFQDTVTASSALGSNADVVAIIERRKAAAHRLTVDRAAMQRDNSPRIHEESGEGVLPELDLSESCRLPWSEKNIEQWSLEIGHVIREEKSGPCSGNLLKVPHIESENDTEERLYGSVQYAFANAHRQSVPCFDRSVSYRIGRQDLIVPLLPFSVGYRCRSGSEYSGLKRGFAVIPTPYLLFLADAPDQFSVKTARGIRDWRPQFALGQLRMEGCQADLGLRDMSIPEANEAGAKTLVIGVANRGGKLSGRWKPLLVEALETGLDIANGLHDRLNDDADLVAAAKRSGCTLHDVRHPTVEYPVATGEKRSGLRCLTVGTDCSVGKMYTSLAIHREMVHRGLDVTFRATGQTGILVSGSGVPLDAVVADFMSGAVEWLSPAAADDHWDVIEGQGSLFHPSYAGVTLALLHGAQPDTIVVCHEPTRSHIRGLAHCSVPSLAEVRDLSVKLANLTNPDAQVVAVSVNTQGLRTEEADRYLDSVAQAMSIPAVDPFRSTGRSLVDAILARHGSSQRVGHERTS